MAQIQSPKMTRLTRITEWLLQLRNRGQQEAVRNRYMDASKLYGLPFVGQLLSYGGFPWELNRCCFGFFRDEPILCRQAVANDTVKTFEQRSRRLCKENITARLGFENNPCDLSNITRAYQRRLQKSPSICVNCLLSEGFHLHM